MPNIILDIQNNTIAQEIQEEDPILAEWNGVSSFLGVPIPGEHYTLFKNRIRIETGIGMQTISETQFNKIDRTSICTSAVGRLFNVGDVILSTKLMKNKDPVLHVKNPEEVMAIINQACYDEKQAYLRSRQNGGNNNAYWHNKPKNSKNNQNRRKQGKHVRNNTAKNISNMQ